MKAEIKNNVLHIEIPCEKKGTMSASGKSEVIATTRGNQSVSIDGRVVSVGVNAYVRVPK